MWAFELGCVPPGGVPRRTEVRICVLKCTSFPGRRHVSLPRNASRERTHERTIGHGRGKQPNLGRVDVFRVRGRCGARVQRSQCDACRGLTGSEGACSCGRVARIGDGARFVKDARIPRKPKMSTTSLAHDRDAEHAAKKAKHEGQLLQSATFT